MSRANTRSTLSLGNCGRARRTLQPLGVKAADPAPPPTPGGLATYTHRGAARCNTKRRVRFKPCTRRLLETACAGWWRLALLAPLHLMGTAGTRKTGGTRGAPAMSHGETSGVDAVKESVNGVVPDIPAVTAGEVPQVRERRCDPRPFRVGPSCTVWRTVDQDHPKFCRLHTPRVRVGYNTAERTGSAMPLQGHSVARAAINDRAVCTNRS